MAHIFISYKRETATKKFVNRLCDKLHAAGFETWVDEKRLHAGEDWREEIDIAIQTSLAVVVVLTPEAIVSQYVTYEWAYAMGIGVPVVPVMYKDAILHPRLAGIHYLDYLRATNNNDFWQAFIARLKELKEIAPKATPAANQFDDSAGSTIDSIISRLTERSTGANDWTIRVDAIKKLGIMKAVKPDLANYLLTEDDADVRAAAAEALGDLGDDKARDYLRAGLKDISPHVRIIAARTLGKLKDAGAVSVLTDLLQDETTGPKYTTSDSVRVYVCYIAADALTAIGTPEALSATAQFEEAKSREIHEDNLPF